MKVKKLNFKSICDVDEHFMVSVPFGVFELIYQYDGMWRTIFNEQEFGEHHKFKKHAVNQCDERMESWISQCISYGN